MEFLKWEFRPKQPVANLKCKCPKCNSTFFWSRASRQEFDAKGQLWVTCSDCNQMYWIELSLDKTHIYTRTNRKEEDY